MTTATTEPQWTAENMNRKQGATTFETCGWCEHTGGGSCRYDCHLETSCSLLPSWRQPNSLTWDTPCLFKQMGQADVQSAMESKRREAEQHRKSAVRSDQQADVLIQIAATKPPIPPQPDNRKHDHFNIGDRVRVFHPDKWNTATVVNGYRHHDGCVSYVFDDLPPLPNGAPSCGMSVPVVMLESEWAYFQQSPDHFYGWLDAADRKYNGNSLPMAAMRLAFDYVRGTA